MKCIEDEIPFELPEGWAWCRLNSIVDVRDGTHDTPTYVDKGIPLITSKNLVEGGIDYSNVKYISEKDAISINDRSGVNIGDILFAMIGTIGNPSMVTEDILISIKNVALFKFTFSKNLSNHFVMYFLDYAQEDMKNKPSGGLQPFVSLNFLRTYLVPVPPVEEQQRIVSILADSINKIRNIDVLKNELTASVKKAKSKILDLAIRGKLVPQDPNDEPASVLLERIRVEKEELIKQGKIKRDKKESIIFRGDDNSYYEKIDGEVSCIDEEIPYDIPDTWTWMRLENCCVKEIRRGKSPKYAEISNVIVFAQKCNTKYNGIDISLAQYLDETTIKRYPTDEHIQDGDIVINSTGTGTLGRVGIYRNTDNTTGLLIVPDSHVTVIRSFSCISSHYLYAFMKAHQTELEKKGEGSTNQKELKPLTLKEMLIAVPPLSEQKRIDKSINVAFSHLAIIEKCLN